MADWEQRSGHGDAGRRKHTTQSTRDRHTPGRSSDWNEGGAVSGDDATLDDLRRGRGAPRNSQRLSGDSRTSRPAPASSRRQDDTWGSLRDEDREYDNYARDPRDGRGEPSRKAQEKRDRGQNYARGSGSSDGRVRERSAPASKRRDSAGPADWDDADWHDPSSDVEEVARGRRSGDGRHGGYAQAPNRYRDYAESDERPLRGVADDRNSRSRRSHNADERNDALYERDWRSAPVDRWREFTGSLLAAADGMTSEHPTGLKRLVSTRRRIVLTSMAAIILLCTLISVPVSAVSAMQSLSLARDGLTRLRSAENSLKLVEKNPFDTTSVKAARADFVAAHDDFVQVSGRLGLIPGVVDFAPSAGSKLSGARHLIPIAVEGTQAAIIACDALTLVATKMKNPFGSSTSSATPTSTSKSASNPTPTTAPAPASSSTTKGLSLQDYATLQSEWTQIQDIFGTVVNQVNALQPSDLTLDPRLGPAIQSFRANMPKILEAVQGVGVLVNFLPQLIGIGQPSHFLIEMLDSTELRPAGGFIGNYGCLILNGGTLSDLKVQDVDLLDWRVKKTVMYAPVPQQYAWFSSIFGNLAAQWGFRDSNLDADFPTSSQNGEKLYAAETPDLQTETPPCFTRKPLPMVGVIAITPWLIQNAIRVTGNLQLNDGYGKIVTVTPDNFIPLIHYYALQKTFGGGCDTCPNTASGTSDRKRFTGFLFKAFMDKVKGSLSGNMGKFAKLFTDSLHSKDIQIYFNEPKVENVLRQFGLAATIDAPATGDSVFKVDANIGGNKSNYVLTYDMSDSITIDASGTATHHLTFKYFWPKDPNMLKETYPADGAAGFVYHSYTRVYVPPSAASFQSNLIWANVRTTKAFGREVYGGDVRSNYYLPSTDTFTLTWKVPGAATHDATGWHYNLLFQKQAGVTVPLTLQIALPSCAILGTHTDTLKASGAKNLTFKDPLLNDLKLSVDYTC